MLGNNIELRFWNVAGVSENYVNGKDYVSAEKYGFDDLVIVPYRINEGRGKRMTYDDIKEIGYTIENLVEEVLDRTEYRILTLMDVAMESEVSEEIDMGEVAHAPFKIVKASNNGGAIGIIPATKELRERYPDGYVVIPSSTDEVLVMSASEEVDVLNAIVGTINETMLDPNKVLSYKCYVFK